jgi:hypothetical protein
MSNDENITPDDAFNEYFNSKINEFKIVQKPIPFQVRVDLIDGYSIYTFSVHGKSFSMNERKFKSVIQSMTILTQIKPSN